MQSSTEVWGTSMDKSKSTNLSKMEFKKVGPVGAEVSNIDLRELSEEQVHEIKSAFLEFSVLVFRGQELNPDNLKKISLILSTINKYAGYFCASLVVLMTINVFLVVVLRYLFGISFIFIAGILSIRKSIYASPMITLRDS